MSRVATRLRRLPRRPAVLPAVLVAAALVLPGCDFLEDRFKTCSDLRIDLVNNRQTGQAVFLTAEGESATPETYLAPGGSRRIVECVRKGDRRTFRAIRDGEVVDKATCVVSRTREALETAVARVEWVPGGFRCQNW